MLDQKWNPLQVINRCMQFQDDRRNRDVNVDVASIAPSKKSKHKAATSAGDYSVRKAGSSAKDDRADPRTSQGF